MIVLSSQEISKSFGTETVLDRVSFRVNRGDRVGIIGANGAGKTTLLEILSGNSPADSGSFFISGDITVGYLRQNDTFRDDRTVLDEVEEIHAPLKEKERELGRLTREIAELAAHGTDSPEYQRTSARYAVLQEDFERSGGFTYMSETRGILNSMAFGDDMLRKDVRSLSGGERTRLALACLLIRKPDLLMLDEPTNHLDIGMLKWLEQFLRGYPGTVVTVSHDRYFLDQLCTEIFELENGRMTCRHGNYTEFAEKKRVQRAAELRAYQKQQDEIKRQEEIIRRFKSHGTEHLAKRAASREKKLERMDRLDKPERDAAGIRIRFEQDFRSGTDVILGQDISKSFYERGAGEITLFRNVNFDIKSGERICIVGPNGVGKTTLLRMIIGEVAPTAGRLKVGHNVDFAYYDQRQQRLNPENTVLEEVHGTYRLYKDSEIRGFLGRFLFKGDSVFLRVADLSGGEKARLALLKLMLSGANVLVLDEPTNHLDISSKEVFEDALLEYPGTVIAVSHDRYFLNRVATKIFELGRDGITRFEGGYDYYEEKRAGIASGKQYLNSMGATRAGGGAAAADNAARDAGPAGNAGTGSYYAGQGRSPDHGQPDGQITAGGNAGYDARTGTSEGEILSSGEIRELNKKRRTEERRNARNLERLEKEIEELEERAASVRDEMCRQEVATDIAKLRGLDEELRNINERLEIAYEEWEKLGDK